MRVYISCAWGQRELARAWAGKIRKAFPWVELHHPWWDTPDDSPVAAGEASLEQRAAVAVGDLVAARNAHALLWVLPGGLGSHCEVGAALSHGVRVVATGPMPARWMNPPHPFLAHPRLIYEPEHPLRLLRFLRP